MVSLVACDNRPYKGTFINNRQIGTLEISPGVYEYYNDANYSSWRVIRLSDNRFVVEANSDSNVLGGVSWIGVNWCKEIESITPYVIDYNSHSVLVKCRHQ